MHFCSEKDKTPPDVPRGAAYYPDQDQRQAGREPDNEDEPNGLLSRHDTFGSPYSGVKFQSRLRNDFESASGNAKGLDKRISLADTLYRLRSLNR